LHSGSSRNDIKGGVLRERGGELLGQTVGEVVLGGIAREVVEGQDGDGLDVRGAPDRAPGAA
jgi:hypothetical protein